MWPKHLHYLFKKRYISIAAVIDSDRQEFASRFLLRRILFDITTFIICTPEIPHRKLRRNFSAIILLSLLQISRILLT